MTATGYVSTTGDTRKVDREGDTMTGELELPDSSPDTALAAASKGYVDARVAELVATIAEKAALAGATFTGIVTIDGADFSVVSDTKGYRFRRGGGALDLEATGADLIVSVWSGAEFNGVQHSYDRYAADALAAQHAGRREFVEGLYGAVVHTIDPDANTLGWHGAQPVPQQTVAGSRTSGAAFISLLAALDTQGLIVDGSSA